MDAAANHSQPDDPTTSAVAVIGEFAISRRAWDGLRDAARRLDVPPSEVARRVIEAAASERLIGTLAATDLGGSR